MKYVKIDNLFPRRVVLPVCRSHIEVDMEKWNSSANETSIESWLKDEGVYDLAVTVPYRQNRYRNLLQ